MTIYQLALERPLPLLTAPREKSRPRKNLSDYTYYRMLKKLKRAGEVKTRGRILSLLKLGPPYHHYYMTLLQRVMDSAMKSLSTVHQVLKPHLIYHTSLPLSHHPNQTLTPNYLLTFAFSPESKVRYAVRSFSLFTSVKTPKMI